MGSLQTRFEIKYVINSDNGCWDWTASKFPNGYGAFDKKYAHRFAYELYAGPIPPKLVIDHLCRNRGCVNPSHMEPVTRGENVLRGEGLAAINKRKTRCVNGHEFTRIRTRPGRSAERVCDTCINERNKKYRAQNQNRSSR